MLRRELEYFFGALRFFTRLPVPGWVGHSADALNHSARYFPLVGLIVGLIGALVFALASFFWPKTLAVLLAMAATIYVTGAFHEDGWADMVDGFGGGWTRERTLEIMKDSRIGSYGAIALVLLLLGKFMALVELDMLLVAPALIAGHALSRLCATSVMHFLDYARDEGKAKPLATHISAGELALASAFGLVGLLLLPPQAAAFGVLFAAAATALLTRKFSRRLGGYTGDCLGATQQLAEFAFYLGLLCRFYLIRHPEPQVALGICYGQLDLPALDVDETADLLRQQLPAGLPLISSPLLRCRMLADALHPSPRFDDRLMEMNFGEWEGRHWDDIGREALNDWAADLLNHAPPGGESVTMLQARSVACLNALAAEGLPACIVVAHAGVMRSAVGHARGLPSTEWTQLKFGYGECVMLAWPAV